jgi:hypothetical protein
MANDYTSTLNAAWSAISGQANATLPAASIALYNAQLNSTSNPWTLDQVYASLETDPFVQNITNPIIRLYQASFGRLPDTAGLNGWVDFLSKNPTQFDHIVSQCTASDEFLASYGVNGDVAISTPVMTAFYYNLLHRAPTASEVSQWVASNQTVTQVLAQCVNSTEFVAKTVAGITTYQNLAANGQTPTSGSLFTLAPEQGTTFTLTIGEDSGAKFTGTSSNDIFNASIVQDNNAGAADTLESFDVLDGGAGTDTLNATIVSGNPAPVLTNIENVNLRFAGTKAVDLTSATGVTTIKVENSTALGTVNGVGSVAALAVANQLKDVNFDGSTATTLALNLNTIANATGATQVKVDLGATAAHKATTLNITANNANVELLDTAGTNVTTTLTVAATGTNTLKLTEAAKATTVTVTGTGSADLSGAAFTGNLTKFDAAANEGGVKADIQSAKAVAVTTGKGNDVVDMDTTVQNDSSVVLGAGNDTLYTGAKLGSFTKGVDGGEGTDIINITDGSKLDATTSKYITNFETLDVSGGKGNYDVSLNSFATVQIDEAIAGALAGAVDFKNAADTFTLTLASKAKDGDFNVVNNITVTGKDYAGTTAKGTAETFTLVANLNDGNKDNVADGNINAQTVTVAGVENVVINANVTTLDGGTDALVASKSTLTANIVAADAEVLTIKGDASVDLSSATTIGVVTKVDATGSTGNVTIDFTGHAKSVAYIGSDGVDTYSAGKAGDIVYTGKGADVVTLDAKAGAAGAVRDTFVLKAATDSQITDTSKDGKITLAADTGFDAVVNFDSVGDPAPVANTSDRLDVTNFNFAGAQRGVADVSASVTTATDLTSIADLFSTPAGDRGIAYTSDGTDSWVFMDADKDGNFTAAADLVIKLAGVTAVSETMINF